MDVGKETWRNGNRILEKSGAWVKVTLIPRSGELHLLGVTPWMTGQRGSRRRAGGEERGVVGVVQDQGRSSPGLYYSVRWVSGRNEGGFGKGFGLSLCAVPLTQLVPHLGGGVTRRRSRRESL
jgi:hypothetical protein